MCESLVLPSHKVWSDNRCILLSKQRNHTSGKFLQTRSYISRSERLPTKLCQRLYIHLYTYWRLHIPRFKLLACYVLAADGAAHKTWVWFRAVMCPRRSTTNIIPVCSTVIGLQCTALESWLVYTHVWVSSGPRNEVAISTTFTMWCYATAPFTMSGRFQYLFLLPISSFNFNCMSAVNASLPAMQASATQLQLEPHSDVAKKNAVFYRQQHGVTRKDFIPREVYTVCEYWCTFIRMAIHVL